ncbi:MAG: cytochrome b N-terminal domain-containing protein [Chloroflexi bacterium]|nr:cytochrome b N-terminal domain-containing protein [Chloroflexota bacterium]
MSTRPLENLGTKITDSRPWRSFWRHGYPNNERDRSLLVFSNVFLHIHSVKVKRHTLSPFYTFGMGLASFYLFVILSVTGVLLMFNYVPATTQAYGNMQDLQTTIPFGQLMRNLHRWSAHGMVVMVILHMLRVFYTGGYKPPREFNWVIGVILLLVTLFLSFTGYLLPWDQLAYWAVTVGTNIAGYAPLIGGELRFVLLGARDVGQPALIRFYTLHIILLPMVAAILISVHFWRIRKDGGLSAPGEDQGEHGLPVDEWRIPS